MLFCSLLLVHAATGCGTTAKSSSGRQGLQLAQEQSLGDAEQPTVNQSERAQEPSDLPVESGATHSAVGADEQPTLSFRAIIRDDNRNQMLESREPVTLEFEVRNEGRTVARDVEVMLSGTANVVEQFRRSVTIGDVAAQAIRRVAVSGTLGVIDRVEQGELIFTLRSSSGDVVVAAAKKFVVSLQPEQKVSVEDQSIDVDILPEPLADWRRPDAVAVAVGVGRFRDPKLPGVKFAARDAEVMAGYFTTVLGVSTDRVRVLTDDHVLQDDLMEVFEEWVPTRVTQGGAALIYFSGRAMVDAKTGLVSFVPYDGSTASASRLFPLHRLEGLLHRAGIQQAIVLLDISLEPSPGVHPGDNAEAKWDGDRTSDHRNTFWMVGNQILQEAHAYEQARHGLFTYYVLRGLRGAADFNQDGLVRAGELCGYVRVHVQKVAKNQYGNRQEPLCFPSMSDPSPAQILPLVMLP